jgi:hypothetical protein
MLGDDPGGLPFLIEFDGALHLVGTGTAAPRYDTLLPEQLVDGTVRQAEAPAQVPCRSSRLVGGEDGGHRFVGQ